jgi:hypothetical protein
MAGHPVSSAFLSAIIDAWTPGLKQDSDSIMVRFA